MLPTQRSPLWYRTDPHQAIRDLPGIGSRLSARVIEDLGDGDAHAALVSIERNPYTLCDVDGIGFKKADKIAQDRFDINAEDIRRHEAGNRFILEQRGVLTEREMSAERIKLELRDPACKEAGAEIEDGLYWLPSELAAERGLERWARGIQPAPTPLPELTPAQAAVLARNGLDEIQSAAAQLALSGVRVMALTGGAGCGKTHVVAAIGQAATVAGKSMRGMAFAGKAADRMREAFERYDLMAEATTIHKALGFMKRAFTVEVLSEDVIVIDESSMLPNWLLWAVVSRLRPGAVLILVGDPNQLPPIGYGTPFADLIAHGIPRAHLSRNYRQADQQGILHMAEGILHRKRPAPAECVEMHLGVDSSNLDALFDDLIRKHGGQDFESWQVITYQNENAERYNLRAQAIINPDGYPFFEYPLWKLKSAGSARPDVHAEIRANDKIIVVKNNTTLGIFNGQTGRVVGMVSKPKLVQRRQPDGSWDVEQGDVMPHLRIEVSGRDVEIPEDEVEKHVQLGYVITVHKAQGSDWNRVIVMQPGKVRDDTARKFFYTACTRAKDHLCIVSSQRVVAWWTNAATDSPDVPSSLTRRLMRPAPETDEYPEEAYELLAAGLKALAADRVLAATDYQPEPGPAYQPLVEQLGLALPLLPSEWDEVRRTADALTLRGAVMHTTLPQPTAGRADEIKAQFKNMEVA